MLFLFVVSNRSEGLEETCAKIRPMPLYPEEQFLTLLEGLPVGYSVVQRYGRSYGLTYSLSRKGDRGRIYAEELGGSDFISLNFYRTGSGFYLNPCEMPTEKVVEFLKGLSKDS